MGRIETEGAGMLQVTWILVVVVLVIALSICICIIIIIIARLAQRP